MPGFSVGPGLVYKSENHQHRANGAECEPRNSVHFLSTPFNFGSHEYQYKPNHGEHNDVFPIGLASPDEVFKRYEHYEQDSNFSQGLSPKFVAVPGHSDVLISLLLSSSQLLGYLHSL